MTQPNCFRSIRLTITVLLGMLVVVVSAQNNTQTPSARAVFTGFSKHARHCYLQALRDTTVSIRTLQPVLEGWLARKRQHTQIESARRPRTRNVIVVTTDGFRWQELFTGADSTLMRNTTFTSDPSITQEQYGGATREERRAALLPFLWSTFATEGQLYGNRHWDNKVNVANGKWFSYPGYNEMLTGTPDDRHVFTNMKILNPNTNVFEYIQRQRGFHGKVAAFSTWDAMPAILHEKRSEFPVFSGKEELSKYADTLTLLHPDDLTQQVSMEYIQRKHPRLAFISFDDTDRHAHNGDYDQYLEAAHRWDAWLANLWQFVQNDPFYRDQTTLILTTDHGRGAGDKWKNHLFTVPHSDEMWIAAIGPDTQPLGEVREAMQIWQEQTAQTIAKLLGHTFSCEHRVAPSIEGMYNAPAIRAFLANHKN